MATRSQRLRSVVRFETERRVDDGQGGALPGKWRALGEYRGEYRPEPGREAIAAGHLEGSSLGRLWVRWTQLLASDLDTSARAIIDDVPHQIRGIRDSENQRHRMLELVVEKNVAPHS
jgi:head-tail adaptor